MGEVAVLVCDRCGKSDHTAPCTGFDPTFHLCRPATAWARIVRHCPTCETRRRMVCMLQPWYDAVITCCVCGESWSGGWRLQRPFARGWRVRESAKARSRWPDAVPWIDACRQLVEDLA